MAGASGSTAGRQAKSVLQRCGSSTGPLEVRIRISVKHLDQVSLACQSFKALVQVEASWVDKSVKRDYHLVEDKFKQNLQVDGHDESCLFFHPRLTLANCLEEQRQDTWVEVYHNTDKDGNIQDPIVCLRYISLAVFQEEFELAWFPFDRQDLSMVLQAGWPSNEVTLVKNQNEQYKSYLVTTNFVQRSEYELKSRIRFLRTQSDGEESATGKVYDQLHMRMHVRRRTGYWVFNILFPLFMISTCAITSYGAPPDELDTRSSIVLTVLLAIIGFKYMIADKLPVINYSTLIDKYVLGCFTFSFIIAIEQSLAKREWSIDHVVVDGMVTRDSDAIDDVGSLSVPALCAILGWFGGNVLMWFVLFLKHYRWGYTQNDYWDWPQTALWIGPTLDGADKDAGSQGSTSDPLSHAVKYFEEHHKGYMDHKSWEPQDAKNIKNANTFQPEEVKPKNPAPVEFAYVGDKVFEIVRFETADQARTALKAFCKEQAERAEQAVPTRGRNTKVEAEMFWALKVKVELLQPEWRALAPFSAAREVAGYVRGHISYASRQPGTQIGRAGTQLPDQQEQTGRHSQQKKPGKPQSSE